MTIPISASYLKDASSEEVIVAASDKIQRQTQDPYPDLEWNEVSTRDQINELLGTLKKSDDAVKMKLTADLTYGSANFLKCTVGTVVFDLNGHSIIGFSTVFNAFGGTIIINDSVGSGMIKGTKLNAVNGVIQARDGGTLILNGGKICTSKVQGDLLYGVYVLNGSTFKMNGGEIVSCSPALNKEFGDVYIKSGKISSLSNCSIISDGQGYTKIYGDAEVTGILILMGHVIVSGHAKVNQTEYTTYDGTIISRDDCENLGERATYDEPCGRFAPVIFTPFEIVTGTYGDDIFTGGKGNDASLTIEGDVKISSVYSNLAVQIATPNTGYDQKLDLSLRRETYNICSHDELSTLCEEGKFERTLKPETKHTEMSISGGKLR